MSENFNDKIKIIMSTAPINIEEIIRLYNIEIDKKADLDPKILGEIRKLNNGKYKISVNKTDHYYRRRFTMAHELGHFLLHGHLIGEGIDDNIAYRSTEDGEFYNANIGIKQETEANQFAASILMPNELLMPKVFKQGFENSNDDIEKLSKEFQVSKEAMKIKVNALLKQNNVNIKAI